MFKGTASAFLVWQWQWGKVPKWAVSGLDGGPIEEVADASLDSNFPLCAIQLFWRTGIICTARGRQSWLGGNK